MGGGDGGVDVGGWGVKVEGGEGGGGVGGLDMGGCGWVGGG